MQSTLTAGWLMTDDGAIEFPEIVIEDGQIVSITGGDPNDSDETLTACFFDIHVHGARSHDFMRASVADAGEVGRFLATCGVAHYLPTTVTGPVDATLRALETLADAIEGTSPPDAAVPVGIHLEGPFVSHAKRGVHPVAYIQQPDVKLFDRFHEAARGHIRLLTIAPEVPRAVELIEHATKLGVRVSIGHSDASESDALAGIAAGATSATHTFNAMRALSHRDPGILGAVLDREDLYAEAICDGVHVHPSMIRLWLKIKGKERAILVTDGMAATGEPDGEYLLGDLPVDVKDGVCLLRGTQTLAGSVLTMDRAVENLQRFTGSSLAIAVRLASSNPARMLGLEHPFGFSAGQPANFNIYDDAGRLSATILRGRRVRKD
jgi:N-acetylglucosamine-6-phosphate deacetylase